MQPTFDHGTRRRDSGSAMPSKYYDAVVIGRSLGALTAAALLARRDFTVLLVGQGRPGANYSVEGRTLRRRAFTMLAGNSPVWTRVMRELAHTQTWRRLAVPLDPMLQALAPATRNSAPGSARGLRLDVPPDAARFTREVEREMPEVRRLIAELYADFSRVVAAADECFEREAIWPPGTFFERRETHKLASKLPYARGETHTDLLGEFPRDHLYRQFVAESVRFATELATPPPAFAAARLHGSWTRGVVALEGGEQALEDMLLERLVANGGELALSERCVGLTVKRSVVSGVTLDGHPEGLGAGFVITDLGGEAVANLSGGEGITKRAQREWPRVTPSVGRFVVSMVVRREGIPAALGREALLLGSPSAQGIAARTLHVQRANANHAEEQLLLAEMLVGDRDAASLHELRRSIVERVCRELPYMAPHLVLADSVHDGLPVWRYEGGVRREIERVDALVAARIEPMDRQIEVDPLGFLGVAGEPVRGPIERTLLCGSSVLPALGQEGRLLAATSAARLVTKTDRRKTRMRREMWTKMEIE